MSDLLPIEPFRDWLNALLVTTDAQIIAERCAVSRRQVHRWLHEDDVITFEDADDALTHEGSTAFWELAEFGWDKKGRPVEVERTPAMDAYRAVLDQDPDPGELPEPLFATPEVVPQRVVAGAPARYIPQPWDPRPPFHEAGRQWRWRLKLTRLRRAAARRDWSAQMSSLGEAA